MYALEQLDRQDASLVKRYAVRTARDAVITALWCLVCRTRLWPGM